MRPFMRTLHVAVFDGIVVDVIQVMPTIIGVSDGMFPEPFQPHAASALPNPRW